MEKIRLRQTNVWFFAERRNGMSCYYKETKMLYGGDYNPEQWGREVWEEDMRLMAQAHINIVTLNVFSWASLQPDEDTYDFARLDEIMQLVRANGMKVCLATSTGAHPAWMAKRHPDILRTEKDGRKRKFGGRHNSCPNSPTYRKYAPRLAQKLAEHYRDYDNIVAWHVSNEYGGACYCDECQKAFRVWLKKKYGTIEEVNRSYNTAFWGHTFYDWDEIVLPDLQSEHFMDEVTGMERTMFQGISLDYMRFNSDSILDCFRLEYDAIKKFTPDLPVTTNLMTAYKGLDYQKWAKSMDFVSWDNYPSAADSPDQIAFYHDLMRGLDGQKPFVLMEQAPSVTNWQQFAKLKRPGEMRLMSYQAVAHGADAIQFFQIRRSIGACEKYHSAVIDHVGTADTRVFREVTKLGEELEKIGGLFLDGKTPAKTAILFDWDNWWAVEYSSGPSVRLKYLDAVLDYYKAAYALNVPVDIISTDHSLEPYQVVIAPLLYMVKRGYEEKLKDYVRQGGNFVTSYFSGIVDEHDLVDCGGYPGRLRELLGVWVEESDALPFGEQNAITYSGTRYPADLMCDLMHLEGAQALANYEEDFYAGTPAVTVNKYGLGKAYYVGTHSDEMFYQTWMRELFAQTGISPIQHTPAGVEAAVRENAGGRYLFLLNHTAEEKTVVLVESYKDLLNGRTYAKQEEIVLEARGVYLLGGCKVQGIK